MKAASKEFFLEHQKYIKLSAKIGILILALAFLLLPGILRGSEYPIGDKPYYHLVKGSDFSRVGIGWNFLLGYFPVNVLLLGIGLLSIFFVFLNLKMLDIEERLLSLGFFAISPAFVYLFNVGERFGIAFLFSLIACYFLLNKNYLYSSINTLLIFLFDIWIGTFIIFISLLYFLLKYDKKKLFYALVGVASASLLVFGDFNKDVISDLGAQIGSSVFALVFATFCFLFFWNRKKFLSLYGAALLLFLFSLKVEFGIFYFGLFLSILLALCFFELTRIKWESKLVRDLILLIFVCGLLFSGLSYVNRISNEKPDEDIFNALNRLPDDAVVFSGINYGNWIRYSGKKSVWNSFMSDKEVEQIEKDLVPILELRDYALAAEALEKYEVDYILLDNELKQKWQNSGLLYLMRYNNEEFRFLFEDDGVEIWRFFR